MKDVLEKGFNPFKIQLLADLSNISGIYCIKNVINNKYYIGASKDIGKRLSSHILQSSNLNLNKDIKKLKVENFSFKTLEIIKSNVPNNKTIKKYLLNLENKWIKIFESLNIDLYNNNNKTNLEKKKKAKITKYLIRRRRLDLSKDLFSDYIGNIADNSLY